MGKQTAEGNSPRLTLSDWLSMVVVVSLLGVVGVPAFLRTRDAVTDSACDANRLLLVTAVERYHQETGAAVQPGEAASLLVKQLVKRGYLQSEPREPLSGQQYRIFIERDESTKEAPAGKGDALLVRVECPVSNHFHGSDSAVLNAHPKAP